MNKILCTAALLLSITIVKAQWNIDTLVRNAICTAAGYQYKPAMCSDGHKGAIIVWDDIRASPQQMYLQRIDSSGKTRWANNGIKLSLPVSTSTPDNPIIISDDAGGAIIIFEVTVTSGPDEILAQHINANGTEQWQTGGVVVSMLGQDSRIVNHDASDNQSAVTDGKGGVFITWQTYSPFGISAQHLNKDGKAVWKTNGAVVTNIDSVNAVGAGYASFIMNAGDSSADVVYNYSTRLYLQRITDKDSGRLSWGDTSVLLTSAFPNFGQVYLGHNSVSAKENVFAVWQDARNSGATGIDLYMQRVDTSGNKLLADSGVVLDNAPGDASYPYIIPDADGGMFVTYLSVTATKVQHIDDTKNILWGTNGIAANIYTPNENPVITADGSGGIISLWHDGRFGKESLYAQHFNSAGNALWRINGAPVIVGNVDLNHSTNAIVSFNKDTAIACWSSDAVAGNSNDIFAARFGGINGILPLKFLSFTATLNNNQTTLNWTTASELNVTSFDIERSTDAIHFNAITSVKAKGESKVINNYSAVDASPLNGINYYRLKEVDVDDFGSYSQVVSVIKKANSKIMLYPNPASDKIQLSISSDKNQTTIFGLYNLSGKLILQKSAQLNTGITTIEFDVKQFSNGVYFIKNKDNSIKLQFVKE